MIQNLKSLVVGFLILLLIQLVSNYLITFFYLNFPAPILGMLILALLLYFKFIPYAALKKCCDLLLKNMSLFFIPLFVGIVSYYDLLKSNILAILVILFCTTFFTMLLTGWVVQYIIKRTQKSGLSVEVVK